MKPGAVTVLSSHEIIECVKTIERWNSQPSISLCVNANENVIEQMTMEEEESVASGSTGGTVILGDNVVVTEESEIRVYFIGLDSVSRLFRFDQIVLDYISTTSTN